MMILSKDPVDRKSRFNKDDPTCRWSFGRIFRSHSPAAEQLMLCCALLFRPGRVISFSDLFVDPLAIGVQHPCRCGMRRLYASFLCFNFKTAAAASGENHRSKTVWYYCPICTHIDSKRIPTGARSDLWFAHEAISPTKSPGPLKSGTIIERGPHPERLEKKAVMRSNRAAGVNRQNLRPLHYFIVFLENPRRPSESADHLWETAASKTMKT